MSTKIQKKNYKIIIGTSFILLGLLGDWRLFLSTLPIGLLWFLLGLTISK